MVKKTIDKSPIKELSKLLEELNLTEISYRDGDFAISVSRVSTPVISNISQKQTGIASDTQDNTDPRWFEFSDATLQILSSNYQPNIGVNFKGCFPISVSTLEFDSSQRDYSYFTCEATFKYDYYTISDKNGKRLDNNPNTY